MASGMTARLLHVDLASRQTRVEELPLTLLRKTEFLAARRVYYEMAGWNPETGRPTAAKLAELGIDAAAIRG